MTTDLAKYKLIIFDLDGTLTQAFTTFVLPGRAERLAELRQDDKQLAICTNQYHLSDKLTPLT